jgi:hypothetical protein
VPILVAIPIAIADAPTQINPTRRQREDPTDLSPPPPGAIAMATPPQQLPLRAPAPSEPPPMRPSPPPPRPTMLRPNEGTYRPALPSPVMVRIRSPEMATAVVARPKPRPNRTWLLIIALVAIATFVALLIALL